ncbi:WD40 repeat-like protein [Macrolepiota fuliginosa MF-IS2]|uniref:WD40 repeat-like protein n=1 Tax=Macrolepiota fuliginosa MF-IS2 TaxID=1400762 RepID=A0A9P6C0S1_9AGAR|nr:WD40 repeat-like protein [Macrolepiota fuliginosa MF-IS2]
MLGNGTGNGVTKHGKAPAVAAVKLPGTLLYEDSFVDREEFVRLVIQSLRDVGYIESAATLEAESGYSMESLDVSQFRHYVLDGLWSKAEVTLSRLFRGDEEGSLEDARFLINQQKYLELLEAKKTTAALQVLRNDLAPMNNGAEQLHTLSSLLMCSDPEELRQRTGWDGASGSSRHQLLDDLQDYIPSSVMIPQRRLSTLLYQAREYQHSRCVYHNSPLESSTFSLYTDHHCNKSDFPNTTTTILQGHTDEVWNMQWSHDGTYLATCGKDKTAIIWKTGVSTDIGVPIHEWSTHLMLREHQYPVGCLAWSLDDAILLTSAEHHIKMWNAQTGVCIETLTEHTETVTALAWLPDGSGFISSALDCKIIHWNADGKLHESWGMTPIRVTDLAITSDFTRLVTIGMDRNPPPLESPSRPGVQTSAGGDPATTAGAGSAGTGTGAGASAVGAVNHSGNNGGGKNGNNKMIIYDLATKHPEFTVALEGELTSVKISQNSRYALINLAPDEIRLWDLDTNRVARKYTGQKQGRHVIRSCFGGVDGNFVVSGSEDSKVYVWHRESGALLEELAGHGDGSVNSVAWNPRNERMFASCSDDNTVRIWEAPIPPGRRSIDGSGLGLGSGSGSGVVSNGKGKGKSVARQRWDGGGLSSTGVGIGLSEEAAVAESSGSGGADSSARR